ncbi:hypothetical protein ACKFKF_09790 [Phormidesmis sp. 146-12]
MNTKLVESLAQIIQSLAPEEQTLLEERLKATPKKDWRQSYQELNELRKRIFARRDGQPLSPEPDEIIWQMREERTAEIMQSLQDS